MNTHSLVSIEDYSKEEILEVLKLASEFEANPNQRLLEGKVVASLFCFFFECHQGRDSEGYDQDGR